MSINISAPSSAVPIDPRIEAVITADHTCDFQTIFNALLKCEKAPTRSFQEIEAALREAGCITHIIARSNLAPGMSIEWPLGTAKTYALFLSVRPQELAMEELLEQSSSYEENFAKLEQTGMHTADADKPLIPQFRGTIAKLTPLGKQLIEAEIAAARSEGRAHLKGSGFVP